MTKTKRIHQKIKLKSDKSAQYNKAVKDFERGKFKSLRLCADFHKLPRSTLHRLVCNGDKFQGSGPTLKCLTLEEEKVILSHVKWRSKIGCGVDFLQLQSLVQESLIAMKMANPDRITGYESTGQWPDRSFVRRMVERNNLSLRRTGEISKGRQILTVSDLRSWQKDTQEFMSRTPELLAALQDPSRVFNMDETSVQIGSSGHRVLAEKNTKVLYSISSGSRDHITASYMVSANGSIVPPRLVFKGVRNVAQTHLKNLPKDGKSGDWQMSVSPKGFVTREIHMEILHDLDKFLVTNEINRPVILFLDGASPHISLDALKFCKEKNIQPWLFRPNMTHLLQPLDLTFFSSLKSELKSIVWNWHGEVANAGQTLNKYSVVVLLQKATEKCLDKDGIISNGFRRAGLAPWEYHCS